MGGLFAWEVHLHGIDFCQALSLAHLHLLVSIQGCVLASQEATGYFQRFWCASACISGPD